MNIPLWVTSKNLIPKIFLTYFIFDGITSLASEILISPEKSSCVVHGDGIQQTHVLHIPRSKAVACKGTTS